MDILKNSEGRQTTGHNNNTSHKETAMATKTNQIKFRNTLTGEVIKATGVAVADINAALIESAGGVKAAKLSTGLWRAPRAPRVPSNLDVCQFCNERLVTDDTLECCGDEECEDDARRYHGFRG